MTTKHKPATPLHGRRIILQGGYVFEVEHQHAEHLDVLERRSNAYPQLVAALRNLNHIGGDERGGYCICPRNDGSAPDDKHSTACANVRALLRSLGESA